MQLGHISAPSGQKTSEAFWKTKLNDIFWDFDPIETCFDNKIKLF